MTANSKRESEVSTLTNQSSRSFTTAVILSGLLMTAAFTRVAKSQAQIEPRSLEPRKLAASGPTGPLPDDPDLGQCWIDKSHQPWVWNGEYWEMITDCKYAIRTPGMKHEANQEPKPDPKLKWASTGLYPDRFGLRYYREAYPGTDCFGSPLPEIMELDPICVVGGDFHADDIYFPSPKLRWA